MHKSIWVLLICSTCIVLTIFAQQKSVNDIQSVDGAQRNKLAEIIGGGGGGGSGDVSASGNNSFTGNNSFSGNDTHSGTNTFTGPTIMFSPLLGNTNVDLIGGVRYWQFYPRTFGGANVLGVYANQGATGGIEVGSNAGGSVGAFGTDNSGNVQITGSGTGYTDMYFQSAGSTMLRMSSTTVTLGANSSSAITMNAGTMTAANGYNINSGMLQIPAAGVGTITNNGSFTTLNTLTASNLVISTTTGTSVLSSGTNQTLQLVANSASGTLQTQAKFTAQTNTLTAALPLINVIYTNNNQRLFVNAGVALPTGLTSVSASALWTVSGADTNFMGMAMSSAGVNGAVTNTCVGWVQPNALYMISNITTTAGTPALVQGMYREVRH